MPGGGGETRRVASTDCGVLDATLEATSNKVILMKFKDSDGDTRWLTVNNSGTVAASDSHS